jgi:hypothetical protein
MASTDPIYIANAGLVLTSPFLPHLFQKLDMLRQDDAGRLNWRDSATASRAVHLTQYLVDGQTSPPEPTLVLNKIICGLPTAHPVDAAITPTPEELQICDSLLSSMIANWTIIAQSSVAALRETFLPREGKLEQAEDRWNVRVQRKTLDVLVDQIPWSIALIRHPWMPEALYVTW